MVTVRSRPSTRDHVNRASVVLLVWRSRRTSDAIQLGQGGGNLLPLNLRPRSIHLVSQRLQGKTITAWSTSHSVMMMARRASPTPAQRVSPPRLRASRFLLMIYLSLLRPFRARLSSSKLSKRVPPSFLRAARCDATAPRHRAPSLHLRPPSGSRTSRRSSRIPS